MGVGVVGNENAIGDETFKQGVGSHKDGLKSSAVCRAAAN
jgi:hypothetical protein